VKPNLRQIANELGVTHVVEGSVQRAANRARVNVQLIDARKDAHLWAQSYDRELSDIFAVESDIASTIADALQAKLTGSERKVITSKQLKIPRRTNFTCEAGSSGINVLRPISERQSISSSKL
jgi:hypothetical protein